jgi:uncharacterized damage-inducible protein DinB
MSANPGSESCTPNATAKKGVGEVRRVRSQIRRSYEGPAWHGPSVRDVLADVTAAAAAAHPIAGVHSIWELVLHIEAWMKEATSSLRGGTYVSLEGDQDWPPHGDATDAQWTAALASLESTHRDLNAAVSELTEDSLCEKVPGKDFSLYGLLHGVAQHNIYHAGQIAVLKKATS